MTSAKLYPGGVVVNSEGLYGEYPSTGKLIVTKPDTKIIELHRSNYTTFVNNESFAFKRDVIHACIRLYGNFYQWLENQQIRNRLLHADNQEFLIDTLWYIKTGERKMMLPVWESIITQYPDMEGVKPSRIDDSMIESFLKNSNRANPYSNYISEWTSHPDGIYDMLYTTYLLFGKADIGTLNKLNLTN